MYEVFSPYVTLALSHKAVLLHLAPSLGHSYFFLLFFMEIDTIVRVFGSAALPFSKAPRGDE